MKINMENVQSAINIMKRAGMVDMCRFQTSHGKPSGKTEADLHECGNSACFARWVAVSPEFQADGGGVTDYGGPRLNGGWDDVAIAEWLEISIELARRLVFGNITSVDTGSGDHSLFYDKPWEEVDAQDVIDKLQLILSGELA